MRNVIHILAYNNLELTKRAVESALAQDIEDGVSVFVTDNGSTDGTEEWLHDSVPENLEFWRNEENLSPVKVGNQVMKTLFIAGCDKILGMPNDVILPPNLYRLMNEFPRGVVTASMTSDLDFPKFETATAVNECTPMCVTLLRNWAYDAMMAQYGHFFDEGFFHYASDCDFALRFAALGMRGCQLDVQYYHETSATLKRSDPESRRKMEMQADLDRAYFIKKWGFAVADPYYGQSAGDLNFKGKPLVSS